MGPSSETSVFAINHPARMGEVLMAVAYYAEVPNATREQAEQAGAIVSSQLGGPAVAPEGGLFHAEGPTDDGGWWIFDIWESAEHFERFNNEILTPAVAQVGSTAIDFRRLDVAWHSMQAEATDLG